MNYPANEPPELLINDPHRSNRTIVLAHGAGAAMDTEFMETFADGLANHGLRVMRFEFPYMAARRMTGETPATRSGTGFTGHMASSR